jgi:hypothetical protein
VDEKHVPFFKTGKLLRDRLNGRDAGGGGETETTRGTGATTTEGRGSPPVPAPL